MSLPSAAVVIRVSYDDKDNHWCLANEELSLEGYGNTYEQALSSLKESLESLIVGYLAFKDAKLSEKSRKIKQNLQTYLELNDYRTKFGEPQGRGLIMPIKQREFSKAALKKGFVRVKSDHCYFYLMNPDNEITHVRTKIGQHGNLKDISDDLLAVMYSAPF